MDRLGSRRRHVASIYGDDTQGWTQGFLGLRGTAPRTGNQKEVLTPKSRKSTYKHYKTGEKPLRNRRHTQGADSKYHRRSRQDKFRQAAKSEPHVSTGQQEPKQGYWRPSVRTELRSQDPYGCQRIPWATVNPEPPAQQGHRHGGHVRIGYRIYLQPMLAAGEVPSSRWGV